MNNIIKNKFVCNKCGQEYSCSPYSAQAVDLFIDQLIELGYEAKVFRMCRDCAKPIAKSFDFINESIGFKNRKSFTNRITSIFKDSYDKGQKIETRLLYDLNYILFVKRQDALYYHADFVSLDGLLSYQTVDELADRIIKKGLLVDENQNLLLELLTCASLEKKNHLQEEIEEKDSFIDIDLPENGYYDWKVEDLSYVHKGDILGIWKPDYYSTDEHIIRSVGNGYLLFVRNNYNSDKIPHSFVLHKTLDDVYSILRFPTNVKEYIDPITNKSTLTLDINEDCYYRFHSVQIGYPICLPLRMCLQLIDNVPYIRFTMNERGCPIKKGDTISLRMTNGEYINFRVEDKPFKTADSDYIFTTHRLYKNVLNGFFGSNVEKVVLVFANGSDSIEHRTQLDSYTNQAAKDCIFHSFINDYLDLLKKHNVDLDSIETSAATESTGTSETCSVYLMMDVSNGYYKIGMSNNPKYREHTLQSEKPTIELVCSKEYPHRKIAEAIEHALHNAFAEKRIRGEWFSLDDKDLTMIITTLK